MTQVETSIGLIGDGSVLKRRDGEIITIKDVSMRTLSEPDDVVAFYDQNGEHYYIWRLKCTRYIGMSYTIESSQDIIEIMAGNNVTSLNTNVLLLT